ncbi:hypothetical protein [Pseudorhodobacter sp.]|uniref:hypothetical protein n=1 Tax=Pseudorhodobacter sp. TaxID=1934400 RepID=UPI00264A43B3|nr:hypothetical protein [Pseudorhodobacter sp.]MDN5787414.1 hypothetical protein [Pseudorhodobacter sp.]
MKFFDLHHPFFLPLWRRVLTVGITAGWAVVELSMDGPGWAALFGSAAAYCAYVFFFTDYVENTKDDSNA